MGVKVNPKSEGRNPNNTAKRQGLAFQISAFGSLSDFGFREPITKLPRSPRSTLRSPSGLPSPLRRGRSKDRVTRTPSGSSFRTRCRRCSLSLRERAGVRGNGSCEYQRGATFAIGSRNANNTADRQRLAFRNSDFGLLSGFGFRVSDFKRA